MNIAYGFALLVIGIFLLIAAPGEGKLIGLASFSSGALMLMSAMSAASNKDESNKKST